MTPEIVEQYKQRAISLQDAAFDFVFSAPPGEFSREGRATLYERARDAYQRYLTEKAFYEDYAVHG